MDVLVLGGTRYVGRAMVGELLERGHAVTIFQRGETNADLFPHVQRVLGDRRHDVARLGDRRFDVVVDTCAYEPDDLRPCLEHLADRTDRYLLVSSVAVHEPTTRPGITEDAPVQRGAPPADPVPWWHDDYARDKVACEELLAATVGPERSLVLRPGMLVGPHDPVWYLATWLARFRRGGRVLVPDVPDQPLQLLDCRDLAAFAGHLVDEDVRGVFLVDGLPGTLTHGELLDLVEATVDGDTQQVPVDPSWLLGRPEVEQPWSQLPYWLPGDAVQGYCRMDVGRALDHGLTHRPLAETLHDVVGWYDREGFATREEWRWGVPPARGLAPEVETSLLTAWHRR